ncbi:hypothetical protein KR054_008767 [Drosophila jambulina]|nr:hypothetical protein KR054_008767 [Drosophila jambulina]
MCFRFLNKIFGSNRHRANAANDETSPRPSLANVRQVSIDTVLTVRSAKSVKSGKATVGNPGTVVVHVGKKMTHSATSMVVEGRQSVAGGSGGGAISSNVTDTDTDTASAGAAAVVAVSGAGDNGSPGKRSSWWGFFGMGRKKSRSSNETL